MINPHINSKRDACTLNTGSLYLLGSFCIYILCWYFLGWDFLLDWLWGPAWARATSGHNHYTPMEVSDFPVAVLH